jgi:hypothetical protein
MVNTAKIINFRWLPDIPCLPCLHRVTLLILDSPAYVLDYIICTVMIATAVITHYIPLFLAVLLVTSGVDIAVKSVQVTPTQSY